MISFTQKNGGFPIGPLLYLMTVTVTIEFVYGKIEPLVYAWDDDQGWPGC